MPKVAVIVLDLPKNAAFNKYIELGGLGQIDRIQIRIETLLPALKILHDHDPDMFYVFLLREYGIQ